MPMGTPTEDEKTVDNGGGVVSPDQEKRAEYRRQGFKFDPETGESLDSPTHADLSAERVSPEPASSDESEKTDDDFTHFVHLADGRVLKSQGVVTHYADSDDPNDRGVPVIAVYPRYAN